MAKHQNCIAVGRVILKVDDLENKLNKLKKDIE